MRLYLLLFGILLIACQSQKGKQSDSTVKTAEPDKMCISFDQRQCKTDAFAAFLPSHNNQDDMFAGMQQYFQEQDVSVLHMRIDMNFHESTCSACDICPEQHRFFVSLPSSEFKKLTRLNLMHLTPVDCVEYF